MTVPDLSTRYLGLTLRSPLVASSSPITGDLDSLLHLEDAGAGAVVLPSLFEEQVTHEVLAVHQAYEAGADSHPEAGTYLASMLDFYNTGQDLYLGLVADAKGALSIPVIASLNGTTRGGWVRYAALLEAAGADALELNIYHVAADTRVSGEEVEARYLDVISAVRDTVTIPLAVKVGPSFSSMAHMAHQMVSAGADGLVLFNRFYQPDLDLTTRDITAHLELSSSDDLRLALRWVAILHHRIAASLGATGGVHTAEDVAKVLLAGADVAMMASALLTHGPSHVRAVEEALSEWMAIEGYDSVEQLKGSLSQCAVADPSAFERAGYMRVLLSGMARYRP